MTGPATEPGPLALESDVLLTALCSPAPVNSISSTTEYSKAKNDIMLSERTRQEIAW